LVRVLRPATAYFVRGSFADGLTIAKIAGAMATALRGHVRRCSANIYGADGPRFPLAGGGATNVDGPDEVEPDGARLGGAVMLGDTVAPGTVVMPGGGVVITGAPTPSA
jgi:hypothetical protein